MVRIITVGPNKAVVITGRSKKHIVTGNWALAFPFVNNVQYLSLQLMTLRPSCVSAETAEGVPVHVSAVAQCKIMNSPEFLLIAAEQFLGKRMREVAHSLEQTLEGHLRAIVGTLTVEELYKDRIKFAGLVREVAETDVAKMGIQIVSFVIIDIDDKVGYLNALGKARTAEVKRDAEIGVAFANRDAGIREAECEKEANAVIFDTKMKIENHSKNFNLQKALYDKEVNTAKAEAELAYALRLATIQQELRREVIASDIIERKKCIEVEQKEIERKERELKATIMLPSEAESYQIQTIAEGKKAVVIQEAIGQSNKIMKVGEAEAKKMEIIGLKDAERMRLRAVTLQNYGDAAVKGLILNTLPEITKKVCSPLEKIDHIVFLGGTNSNIIGNLAAVAAQIPPTIDALHMNEIKNKLSQVIKQ